MLLVLAACAPAQRVELPEASAEARVVGVALDADGEVREVLGPFLLADVPSFDLPAGIQALAAFVLEPSEWRSVEGAPLTAEAWAELRVLPPDEPGREGQCTSCAAPRDAAPALVAPGDRCGLPPFVRGAVTVDGAEPADPSWLERARAALDLGWGGVCGERWAPLSPSRALPVGCGWAPSEAPVVVDHVAEAEDGAILGVSSTGLWWTELAPSRGPRSGSVSVPGRIATSVVAVAGSSPRRWLLSTRSAVGASRPLVHIMEDDGLGYTLRGQGSDVGMVVGALVRPLGEAQIFAVGREAASFSSRPTTRPCVFDDDVATCTPQDELISACIDADDATLDAVRADGRVVSPTQLGRWMVNVTGSSAWACPQPYDGRYRDARGGTREVRRFDTVVALGSWVYACGTSDAGGSVVAMRVPSATRALDRVALAEALDPRAYEIPSGPCGGFAATATPGVALLWSGDRRIRVDDAGHVDVLPGAAAVGEVQISAPLTTLRFAGAGRVYRSRSGGAEELVLGAELRTPTLVGLAPSAGGFVGIDDGGGAWAIDVPDVDAGCAAVPRPAPRELVLEGPSAAARAWARSDDGAWWGWREPSTLVRVDVAAGRREAWSVEPPLDVSDLVGTAVVSADELVVVTPQVIQRVRVRDGAAVLSGPIALEIWDTLRAPIEPRWSAVGASGGVVWVAGDDALARVTSVTAEVSGVAGWAEQVATDVRSQRTDTRALVVLAPDHVLLSTLDIINGVDNTRVLTYEVAPRDRTCTLGGLRDGARLGSSLRVCLFPDGNDPNTQTSSSYAPDVGVGPSNDPLLINGYGLVYRGNDGAEGLGVRAPVALGQDARGVFVLSGEDGQLFVGRRELRSAR